MKINCPNCNASGNIPEYGIPDEGRFLSCPSCKHGFTINKPRSTNNAYLVDTCPKCGMIVKVYVERQREELASARGQVLLGDKFTSQNPVPPAEPVPSSVGDFVDNLHPVVLIGWRCGLAACDPCHGYLGDHGI